MKAILGRVKIGIILCVAAPAQAIVWTDDQSIGIRVSEGDSVSGIFNLDGFDPLRHTISEVTVSFAFSDGRRREDRFGDWADIRVGTDWIWTRLEVDGTKQDGFDWVSASLSGRSLADLQRDGSIGYLVRAADLPGRNSRNDFHFEQASVKVLGEENFARHSVPDGGHSLILLALGLIALAGVARIAKNRSLLG